MLYALLLLTAAYPLWRAWRANRQTSLTHALAWATAAWAAWVVALAAEGWPAASALGRYLALALTGCAGVAVLGARRPGVAAWNFVVVGLLAVLLLPVAEGFGKLELGPARVVFLAAALAVAVVNYLPTRLGPAALMLGAGCGLALARLVLPAEERAAAGWLDPLGGGLLALSPWAALALGWRRAEGVPEFDRLWLAFRDRFGLVWGQRMREQFNRAAANAGWPVVLGWGGLRVQAGAAEPGPAAREEMLATLRAVLKRFGPESGELPA
ncbi:MAG TPA: hypothetical protein VFA26_19095 [Gemmataceae bacterium]|nr:hypothetical protein [Gemmataceae bacterium]